MSKKKVATRPLHEFIGEQVMADPEFLRALENEWTAAARADVARDIAALREESQRLLLRPESKSLVEGWLLRAEDVARGAP